MPTAVTYVLAYAASTAGIAVGSSLLVAAGYLVTALAVSGIGASQRRKAARRARDAANAALQDRLVMTQTTDGRRSRGYGIVRNVDEVIFQQTHGEHNQYYTLVVSVLGHKIHRFLKVYFGDTEIETDEDGWVLTPPWNGSAQLSGQVAMIVVAGSGSVELPHTPIAGTVSMSTVSGDTGYSATPIVSGKTVSITGAVVDGTWTVNYQYMQTTPKARVRKYLGGPDQNLYADLVAVVGDDLLQPSDRFANDATLLCTFEYDQDVFPQGIPNPISALMEAAEILDPRTGEVGFTENPAVIAYDWARHEHGGGCAPEEINLASVLAAANACDVSTAFRRADGSTETRPLYQCGIVIPLEGSPDAWMDEIVESMAGKWDWDGGQLIMRAGVYRAPVATVDESWITDKQAIQIVPQTATADLVNVVRPTIVDAAHDYIALPVPEVRFEAAIAADGRELPQPLEMHGVTHDVHAQHIGRVLMRESREGLTVTMAWNMRGLPYQLFDVLSVDLPLFGWRGKQFELVGKAFHAETGIIATLKETSAEIYDPTDDLQQLTVSENTMLPKPTEVPQVTGLAVQSGTTDLRDRSLLVRTLVSWDPVPSMAVQQSGKIEVQWIEATATLPSGDWPGRDEAEGSATGLTIVGLRGGVPYLFRVRARTTLGVRGPWSRQVLQQTAEAPPVNVTVVQQNVHFYADLDNGAPDDVTVTGSTVSWTNDTAWVVPVHVEASYASAYTYDGGMLDVAQIRVEQTGALEGSYTHIFQEVTSAATTDQFPGKTMVWQFTVAPGGTVTVAFKARVSGDRETCAIHVDASVLRLTAMLQ